MEHSLEYETGFRDGRIRNLEQEVAAHTEELKGLRETITEVNASLSRSIRALERIFWIVLGMLTIIQFMPYLSSFVEMLVI